MRIRHRRLLFVLALGAVSAWHFQAQTSRETDNDRRVPVSPSLRVAALTAVPFQGVHIEDAFWSPRIAVNRQGTIEANLHQCEITGRIKNFAVAGKLEDGKFAGLLFNDSDVYKTLEGIAYALSSKPDPGLEKRADAIIDKIAAAQR